MITKSPEELACVAAKLAAAIGNVVGNDAEVGIEPGIGRVGGGALPLGDLPGPRVSIRPLRISAARFEEALRFGDPPVIGLVKENCILLDPRTLLPGQSEIIPDLVLAALSKNLVFSIAALESNRGFNIIPS